MNSIIIPRNYLNNLLVLSKSGRESTVYLSEDSKEVFKIYSNSSFAKPTKEKIYELYSRQGNISNTILPSGLVFTYNDQNEKEFIGIILKYFNNYVSIDTLNESDIDMNVVLTNLVNSIKELTENNIYPTDLNNKNILVLPETLHVQLIDLDGDHCIVSNKLETEKLNDIYGMLLYHIYSPIREKSQEIDMAIRKFGYEALLTYGYSSELVRLLNKEEKISFDKLINIIDELYPKKELSHKI